MIKTGRIKDVQIITNLVTLYCIVLIFLEIARCHSLLVQVTCRKVKVSNIQILKIDFFVLHPNHSTFVSYTKTHCLFNSIFQPLVRRASISTSVFAQKKYKLELIKSKSVLKGELRAFTTQLNTPHLNSLCVANT